MMCSIGLVLFIMIGVVKNEKPTSYEGFRVYEVIMNEKFSPECAYSGLGVSVLNENHIFTKKVPYTVCSFLVSDRHEEAFRKALNTADAVYNVAVSNVGKLIREEQAGIASRRLNGDGFNSKTYLSYDEMVEFLSYISKIQNPLTGKNLAVVENIGTTYEGRYMFGVKISSDHQQEKPIIFFEAGVHAREWTAPAAALYAIQQLVENYTYNADVLRGIDFYFIPLSNPDGYEYSRTKDRLWRKTRSIHVPGYYGVDLNRNFDFHWGETGSSSDPASNVYKGPSPFSELETKNIRDTGEKYRHRIKAFVSIHSYGPYLLYPWGYSKQVEARDTSLLKSIALKASEAMKKFGGSEYEVGQSSALLYEASGASDDYFKGVVNVSLSYTIELSTHGVNTFIPSPDKVYYIVAEAFEGFKVLAQSAAKDKVEGSNWFLKKFIN